MYRVKDGYFNERAFDCLPYDDQLRAYTWDDGEIIVKIIVQGEYIMNTIISCTTRTKACNLLYSMGYIFYDREWAGSIKAWRHPNTRRWAELVELPTGTIEIIWRKM